MDKPNKVPSKNLDKTISLMDLRKHDDIQSESEDDQPTKRSPTPISLEHRTTSRGRSSLNISKIIPSKFRSSSKTYDRVSENDFSEYFRQSKSYTDEENALRHLIGRILTNQKPKDKHIKKLNNINLQDPVTGDTVVTAALHHLCMLELACMNTADYLLKIFMSSKDDIDMTITNNMGINIEALLKICNTPRITELVSTIERLNEIHDSMTLDKILRKKLAEEQNRIDMNTTYKRNSINRQKRKIVDIFDKIKNGEIWTDD